MMRHGTAVGELDDAKLEIGRRSLLRG